MTLNAPQVADIGGGLLLRGLDDAPILASDVRFAPARFLIHEWREYVIEPTASAEAAVTVVAPNAGVRSVGNAVIFGFQNQLGLARLKVTAGSEVIPLVFEVLSPKFPTAEAHAQFYFPLVSDLSRQAVTMPFTLAAPTQLRARESNRRPSRLFTWHFLRSNRGAILEALRTILHAPRRALTQEQYTVAIDRATGSDIESLVATINHPGGLQAVPSDSPAYAWPLAHALEHPQSERRFLPAMLDEWRTEETLDTPEHRFVRAFVLQLLESLDRIRRWLPPGLGVSFNELAPLQTELNHTLRASFLNTAGAMTFVPTGSRILQRAHGYRELLQLWRLFNMAADPFERLDQALDARDVATMYEWWCFYKLVRRYSAALHTPIPHLSTTVHELAGLPWRIRAIFSNEWKLEYNQTFSSGHGLGHSYSLPQRPDYVLSFNGQPTVALDAKFRFDQNSWRFAAEQADTSVVGPVLSASEFGLSDLDKNVLMRTAKAADIYKMHTYRDALGLQAAVVVYPGTDGGARFYHADIGSRHGLNLEDLLVQNPPKGVGAFPLSPEKSR